jgi:hypothetical protein
MTQNRGGSSGKANDDSDLKSVMWEDEWWDTHNAITEAEEEKTSLSLPRNISPGRDTRVSCVGVEEYLEQHPKAKEVAEEIRKERMKALRSASNRCTNQREDPQFTLFGSVLKSLFGGAIGGDSTKSRHVEKIRKNGKDVTTTEKLKAAILYDYGANAVGSKASQPGFKDQPLKDKREALKEEAHKAGVRFKEDVQGTSGEHAGFWTVIGEWLGFNSDEQERRRSEPQQLSIEDVPGYEPPKGGVFGEDLWAKNAREQRNAERLAQQQSQGQGQGQTPQEEEDTSVSDFVKWFFGPKE